MEKKITLCNKNLPKRNTTKINPGSGFPIGDRDEAGGKNDRRFSGTDVKATCLKLQFPLCFAP